MALADVSSLPVLYNENYLILLIRDPGCLFAYWEISTEKRKEVNNRGYDLQDQPLTIRVYDLTGVNSLKEAHGYFDLEVHPMADNYFIKDLKARRSYCVELGIKKGDTFFSVMCSNIVQTPPDSFADGSGIVYKEMSVGSRDRKAVKIGSFSTHGIYGSAAEAFD